MNSSVILLAFFAQSAETQTIAELFDVLDTNKDGKVAAAELSDSQKPHFARSLRVADRNEDGALSRDELATAVTEPEKMVIDTSAGRQRGNFDPSQLDRNKDGKLSRSEIPERLKERFQRAFNAFGGGDIPLAEIRKMMQGQTPNTSKNAKGSSDKKMMDEKSMKDGKPVAKTSGGMATLIQRLDVNRDGTLSRKELEKAPYVARAFDRNRDGEITPAELSAAKRSQKSNMATAPSFFDRLDADKDGKLSATEIPQRMRQRVRQIDKNGDKSISKEEFAKMMQRLSPGK